MSEGLDRLERIARSISVDALLGPVMRACPLPGDQEGDLHPFETRNIHPDLPSKVRSLFDDGYGEQSVFEAFKFVISKDADQLHQFLHSPFSPWQITLNLENLLPPSDEWTRIPDNLIGIKWI